MDWSQLKSIEAGWEPSLAAQNLLVERIYQREIGPKTFYFPILKPLLAVAAIAVLLFGLLLLWPKKPIEEQVVTLPGSSSAAKPDEYVEDKEEAHQQETIKTPVKEEAESGQQGGLPFNEALAIVKKKATSRNFDEALTEEQRKAFSAYLAHENYYYLQGQLEGEIGRLKESGAKTYTLEMQVFTTKEYLGKNLFHDLPFGTLVEQSAVIAPNQQENPYFYPRILGKELDASANYLENLTVESALPDGRAAATLSLGEKPLTKKQCETLINRFLAIEGVTWVEFAYYTNETIDDPSVLHRDWEKLEQMPFEEATAIAQEKIIKRFNEKLSNRERMAFYVLISTRFHQIYGNNDGTLMLERIHLPFEIYVSDEYIGKNPAEDFGLEDLDIGSATIYFEHDRPIIKSQQEEIIRLPIESSYEIKDAWKNFKAIAILQATMTFNTLIIDNHNEDISLIDTATSDSIYDRLIRHFMSIDGINWIALESEHVGSKNNVNGLTPGAI